MKKTKPSRRPWIPGKTGLTWRIANQGCFEFPGSWRLSLWRRMAGFCFMPTDLRVNSRIIIWRPTAMGCGINSKNSRCGKGLLFTQGFSDQVFFSGKMLYRGNRLEQSIFRNDSETPGFISQRDLNWHAFEPPSNAIQSSKILFFEFPKKTHDFWNRFPTSVCLILRGI